MTGYDRVRFIGYAVPTTPADMIPVGDPDGTGAVAGTYRASADFQKDIRGRAAALKRAVDAARAHLEGSPADGVLNVFVAPEFFWHGAIGPYVHKPGDVDPADEILAYLREQFPASDYPGFLLVLGTVISAEVADIDAVLGSESATVRNSVVRALGEGWAATSGPLGAVIFDQFVNFVKNCHAYPLIEVRNRAIVISSDGIDGVLDDIGTTAITTEKYYCSNEDFLLWDVEGRPVVTEQLTGYRVLDISGGDFKRHPTDPYAIFTLSAGDAPVTVGVEVCLDHSDTRLRRGAAHSAWRADGDGIDLHLVPSCGMQLHPASVASRAGGWVFNCDGQYALGGPATAGFPQRSVVGGVDCAYTDYTNPEVTLYGAHTQLARIGEAALGGERGARDSHDARFDGAPDVDVTVVTLDADAGFDEFFAGGPGAIHIYGKASPVPLRTAV